MENNNQKNKRIGIILIISIVIIIIALSIVGYKMFQDDKNEETPEETTPEKVISGSGKKSDTVGNELTAIESSTIRRK